MLTIWGAGSSRKIRPISSREVGASTNVASAPAAIMACARSRAASRPSTARASVRATIWKSPSRRVSTAALTLAQHLGQGNHILAFEMSAPLREDLVLDLEPGRARALQHLDGANHAEGVAKTRVGIDQER